MCHVQQQGTGVCSLYFLIQQNNQSLRPILDLRPLNRYRYQSIFTTLQDVIPLLQQGDFMAALDLNGASSTHRSPRAASCSSSAESISSSPQRQSDFYQNTHDCHILSAKTGTHGHLSQPRSGGMLSGTTFTSQRSIYQGWKTILQISSEGDSYEWELNPLVLHPFF